MQLSSRQTGFVRTEGGLLPADLLERVRALDRKLPGLDEASYGLPKSERFGEATTRAWNNLIGAWTTFGDELAKLSPNEPATTTTRERFLLPLMVELGYGRLSPTRAIDLDGKSYPISLPSRYEGGSFTVRPPLRGNQAAPSRTAGHHPQT